MKRAILWVALLAPACGGAPSSDDAGSGVEDSGSAGDSGLDTAIGSCDLRATAMYCQEYDFQRDALPAYEQACTDGGGTWTDAPCPRTDSTGGCRSDAAGFGTLTNWFYAGGPYPDAASVMAACAAGEPPSEYVAP